MDSSSENPYRPPATESGGETQPDPERDLLIKSAIAGVPAAIMIALPGTICVGFPAAVLGDIAFRGYGGLGSLLGFLLGASLVPFATWASFILFRRYLFAWRRRR